jgi:hypothetical protein
MHSRSAFFSSRHAQGPFAIPIDERIINRRQTTGSRIDVYRKSAADDVDADSPNDFG